MGSKTKQSGTSVGTTTPTFTGRGQDLLNTLSRDAMSNRGTGYRRNAGDIYSQVGAGGMNPYVEEAITRSNEEGTRLFDRGMAGMRAQGYRGGTAQNLFGQGDFGSTFASRLAGVNANTRMNAFDAGENRRLAAAGGLTGLGGQEAVNSLQLLNMLRGEQTDQQQKGKASGISGEQVASGIGTAALLFALM